MFRKPSPEDLKLKEQINAVLDSMSTFDPETPQYYKLSKRLAELNELKKSNKDAGRIDSNTALLVAGNLLGIRTCTRCNLEGFDASHEGQVTVTTTSS